MVKPTTLENGKTGFVIACDGRLSDTYTVQGDYQWRPLWA